MLRANTGTMVPPELPRVAGSEVVADFGLYPDSPGLKLSRRSGGSAIKEGQSRSFSNWTLYRALVQNLAPRL